MRCVLKMIIAVFMIKKKGVKRWELTHVKMVNKCFPPNLKHINGVEMNMKGENDS